MKALLKTLQSWKTHEPFAQSAAAAYYATFSLPALLLIVITIASLFFEHDRVETQVIGHLQSFFGADVATSVQKIINQIQLNGNGGWAMLVGGATLLFGATGLFVQLQRSLNHIWEVELRKSAGFVKFFKARATAFGLILVIGFLLMISLTFTALITLLKSWISLHLPHYLIYVLYTVDFLISFGIVILLFTFIFKFLPDVKMPWRFAFLGGLLSSVLFTLGEYLLNFYFDAAQPQTAFGAAGSLILLMMWVSYSCLILLLGAEYTKACMEEKMGGARPNEIAKKSLVTKS